jgi:SNF2 family DNA or RNA helicase
LRDHFRFTLKDKIDKAGWERAKMHVLEALLRLRQAACHPGLLDKNKSSESSSKLDTLLEQLQEVIQEGHKALVFSQFTSFLSIVRERLNQEKIGYEYLDGKTQDRQKRVNRFQSDKDCPVFLISLKAGGTGLNLTQAGYVFILDPWWNPAVESQAIDRTHRIGQTQKVFAYKMIARGTIEEKILELQKSKRKLAESVVREGVGFLKKMTRQDLELLLS